MFYDIYSQLCADKGVSPSRAAADLGFYRSSVSYWKKSGGSPGKSGLKKMSAYFNVPIEVLTSGDVLPPANQTQAEDFTSEEVSSSTEALPTAENSFPARETVSSGESTESKTTRHKQDKARMPAKESEANAQPDSKVAVAPRSDTSVADRSAPAREGDFLSAMELARASEYIGNVEQEVAARPGQRIRVLRRQKGLSVDYVAKAVRVDKTTLLMWESGEINNIRRYKLGKLAKILETTVDYLLGSEDIAVGRVEDFDLQPFIEILKARGECLAMLIISRDMSRDDIELTINFMRSLKVSD